MWQASKKIKPSRVVALKAEGNTLFGRHGSEWNDNIERGVKEIGWADVNWILLAQDRDSWLSVVNTAMKLRVP